MSAGDRSALLVVDVQNDFCEGGSLAVPNADRVVSALNRYLAEAAANQVAVYASRDWHPAMTSHFKPYGGEWPVHCVRDTPGAAFHHDLHLPDTAIVVTKGEGSDSPGYSAFEGRTAGGTPLLADLRSRGIHRLFVGGLATDYCVRHTVLDALSAGDIEVTLLEDAVAGVDPDSAARAVTEMREKGARIASCTKAPGFA